MKAASNAQSSQARLHNRAAPAISTILAAIKLSAPPESGTGAGKISAMASKPLFELPEKLNEVSSNENNLPTSNPGKVLEVSSTVAKNVDGEPMEAKMLDAITLPSSRLVGPDITENAVVLEFSDKWPNTGDPTPGAGPPGSVHETTDESPVSLSTSNSEPS